MAKKGQPSGLAGMVCVPGSFSVIVLLCRLFFQHWW